MMKRPSGLGRGLGALIPPAQGGTFASNDRTEEEAQVVTDIRPPEPVSTEILADDGGQAYRQIPVSDIVANPHQPRLQFDHGALEDLVSSIQELGVVEPLIVTRKDDGKFELIAGERRLRASRIAGLETVPCIIRTATEQEKLELAIIENVQRHDLNPIEEARAYRRLIDEFNLTQDEVGKRVGKSRPQVGNTLRLLQLPEEIQQALMDRKISSSNARTLLAIEDPEDQIKLFNTMMNQEMTARQAESRIPHSRRRSAVPVSDPNLLEQERILRETIGHRVKIHRNKKGEGDIRVEFKSDEDLVSLINHLLGTS